MPTQEYPTDPENEDQTSDIKNESSESDDEIVRTVNEPTAEQAPVTEASLINVEPSVLDSVTREMILHAEEAVKVPTDEAVESSEPTYHDSDDLHLLYEQEGEFDLESDARSLDDSIERVLQHSDHQRTAERLLAAEFPQLSDAQVSGLASAVAAHAPGAEAESVPSVVGLPTTAAPLPLPPVESPARETTSLRYINNAGAIIHAADSGEVLSDSDMESNSKATSPESPHRGSKLSDAQARQLVDDNIQPRRAWHNPAEYENVVRLVHELSAARIAPERIKVILETMWVALRGEDGRR